MNLRFKILNLRFLILICVFTFSAFAQGEILTNANIVELSKTGLDKQIILKKIAETPNNFDISVNALIELQKAGVDSDVIALMMEKAGANNVKTADNQTPPTDLQKGFSDSVPENSQTNQFTPNVPNPKQSLLTARTIAIEKSSINPSRQALEKELLKRKEWKNLNLSIVRYKEAADLYIEIGFVHFSVITHRYVFRVYDRRSGAVICAGETTSWGSLAENLAREIAKKMNAVITN